MPKKKKATTPAHRSTLHLQIWGRNRRFEDSRDKRGKQKLRRDIQRELG